jgi:hypothetical protein
MPVQNVVSPNQDITMDMDMNLEMSTVKEVTASCETAQQAEVSVEMSDVVMSEANKTSKATNPTVAVNRDKDIPDVILMEVTDLDKENSNQSKLAVGKETDSQILARSVGVASLNLLSAEASAPKKRRITPTLISNIPKS